MQMTPHRKREMRDEASTGTEHVLRDHRTVVSGKILQYMPCHLDARASSQPVSKPLGSQQHSSTADNGKQASIIGGGTWQAAASDPRFPEWSACVFCTGRRGNSDGMESP